MIIKSNCLILSKNDIKVSLAIFYQLLYNELKTNYDLSDFMKKIPLFDDGENIYLPYYFLNSINRILKNINHIYEDDKQITYDYDLFTMDNFKPRDWQAKALNIILKNNLKRGIIKIPTGAGKTIFSIYLMKHLNQKYIVVVDDKNLLSQWQNSILKVYDNIEKSELIVITSEYNKKKLEKDLINPDKKIIITTVQSLLSFIKKDFIYYRNLFKQSEFNAIIYDEAHLTSSAELYSKSLILFDNFKYIYGLTATPKISSFPIHYYTIGKEIINAEMVGYVNEYKENLQYILASVKFKNGFTYKKYPSMNYIQELASYQSSFENKIELMKLLYSIVVKQLKENRKILISVNRIETANKLEKIFKDNTNKIIQILNENGIKKDSLNVLKLTSEVKNRIIENADIVIATYKISGKGLDIPEIDTLIILPFIQGNVSLVQLIGRILREKDGKQPPKVIQLVEENFLFKMINDINDLYKRISRELNLSDKIDYSKYFKYTKLEV